MRALRGALVAGAVLVSSTSVWAQGGGIDIHNRYGPSGTRFDLPMTTSIYPHHFDISTDPPENFSLLVKIWHQQTMKFSESLTVVDPPAVYSYDRDIDMVPWGLVPGDVVTFWDMAKLVSNPRKRDTDYLYGDVVNDIAFTPAAGDPTGDRFVLLDRRARYEWLLRECLA